jgi:uncharacterized protein with PIN domain
MTTTKTSKTTREIAGHSFTLTKGRRYVATRQWITREWLNRNGQKVTVTVTDQETQEVAATVPDLTYDQANELLAAFNNGRTSWEGRLWA